MSEIKLAMLLIIFEKMRPLWRWAMSWEALMEPRKMLLEEALIIWAINMTP